MGRELPLQMAPDQHARYCSRMVSSTPTITHARPLACKLQRSADGEPQHERTIREATARPTRYACLVLRWFYAEAQMGAQVCCHRLQQGLPASSLVMLLLQPMEPWPNASSQLQARVLAAPKLADQRHS